MFSLKFPFDHRIFQVIFGSSLEENIFGNEFKLNITIKRSFSDFLADSRIKLLRHISMENNQLCNGKKILERKKLPS